MGGVVFSVHLMWYVFSQRLQMMMMIFFYIVNNNVETLQCEIIFNLRQESTGNVRIVAKSTKR